VKVTQGRTYLLRLVNSCLNFGLFFAVANHSLNVVQLDSAYVEPFTVNTVLIAPGQTLDALLTANQSTGRYYMAASPYSVPDPVNVSLQIWCWINDSCYQALHHDIIRG
jgi:laccase